MSGKKPCCAVEAARSMKKLNIGGVQVGISQLDKIIEEVFKMDLKDENEIKREILKRAKIYNYISPGSEKDYEEAFYAEYRKQRRS